MNPRVNVRAALLAGLVLALGACQQSDAPAPAPSGNFAGPPDAKPGLVGTQARLVLPAVAGRPGAAYFAVRNDSGKATAIVSVHIDGVGKAEMHKTEGGKMAAVEAVPVETGSEAVFAPGGLHVMAFDIDPGLVSGSKAEMTLTFAGGDKLSMPVAIEAMGADMGEMSGMAGMDHAGMDMESAR